MTLSYEWDSNVIIYSLWIESLLMEASNNKYFQWKHHDISWDGDNVSPWVILRMCVQVYYDYNNFLSET